MAGITKDTLKGFFSTARKLRELCRIRLVFLGEGACAIDAGDFDDDGKTLVFDIFKSLGKVVELDEKNILTRLPPSAAAAPHTFILS
ncbi:MAG: hypothetical protein L6V85_07095 [Clostridiales bacterium]|nr:MAG: hypothetical protein L6V85_07095 [Clostridiales bacterium]